MSAQKAAAGNGPPLGSAGLLPCLHIGSILADHKQHAAQDASSSHQLTCSLLPSLPGAFIPHTAATNSHSAPEPCEFRRSLAETLSIFTSLYS